MIRLYDDTIEERVIPAQNIRPSFRIIVDTPLTKVGDIIEITTKVNGEQVSDTIQYVVDIEPNAGNHLVGVVSLGMVEQPIADLPTTEVQIEKEIVTKSPSEKVAILNEFNVIK